VKIHKKVQEADLFIGFLENFIKGSQEIEKLPDYNQTIVFL
jgi:hypothetical protein